MRNMLTNIACTCNLNLFFPTSLSQGYIILIISKTVIYHIAKAAHWCSQLICLGVMLDENTVIRILYWRICSCRARVHWLAVVSYCREFYHIQRRIAWILTHVVSICRIISQKSSRWANPIDSVQWTSNHSSCVFVKWSTKFRGGWSFWLRSTFCELYIYFWVFVSW